MALSRYVVTATTTVAARDICTPAAGEPGTGGAAGFGNASIGSGAVLWPTMFIAGTAIIVDSASVLYAALSGSLRPYVQGQDDRAARP